MSVEKLTILEFNTHFGLVHSYLNANKVRLGISAANLDAFNKIYESTTPANDPMNWQDTWPTYEDPAVRNNNAEKNIGTLRKQAEAQMRIIYNDIPASKWTDTDRNTLRRKTGAPRETTSHDESITSSCLGLVKKLGGGEMDFGCRTVADSSRPSVPSEEGADGVLISYSINTGKSTGTGTGGDPDGSRGVVNPPSPDACPKQKFFPGATFRLKLGAENEGMMLQYYLQWHDSKHPERSGPAGELQTTLIS